MDHTLRGSVRRAKGGVNSSRASLPVYSAWLAEQIRARSPAARPRSTCTFSVITSVYVNTDADLFRLATASVFGQLTPVHELIVLAHGPVSAALDGALREIAAKPVVKVFRLDTNLGIMGAMRFCLERATGRYVVPLDADDLLTPDALAIFAHRIAELSAPPFLFSDEDIYIDDQPRFPYWRPGWDPILNLESSYIWHACAIRRDVALDLDLYTNKAAEFCHDWDTVFRMVDSGISPVHVPDVLYHWRHHTRSTTNNADAGRPDEESGSIRSVRATLNARIARTGQPHRYEVSDFPVFRGSRELYIARKEVDPAPMEALILQRDEDAGHHCAVTVAELGLFITAARRARVHADMSDFLAVLGLISAPYVIVIGDSVRFTDTRWYWEALRLFEIHADVSIVTGRLVDSSGTVQVGPLTFDDSFKVIDQYRGRAQNDPGHFALALKPLTVPLTSGDFFIARTGHLHRYCAAGFSGGERVADLGGIVSIGAANCGGRIAFSPLVQAVLSDNAVDGGSGVAAFFESPSRGNRLRSLFANQRFGASRFVREGSSYVLA
jgi:hypothetical protein